MAAATTTIPDYRIMLSGKATFTLESSGKRYTYRVKRVESEQEGRDPSRLPINSDPCRGIAWLIGKLFNNQSMPAGVRLLWADQCQRCGRKLTAPSSIDARLGPDCAGMV